MTNLRVISMIATAAFLVAPALAETNATPSATTKTTLVPDRTLDKIQSYFIPPSRNLSPTEAIKILSARMNEVLKVGRQGEKEYPGADNLHEVRIHMLRAADFLAMAVKDEASRKRLGDIAGRILSSDAPLEAKALADMFLTRHKIETATDPAGDIRSLAKRYETTEAAAIATLYATTLAKRTGQDDVADELIGVLESKHLDDYRVRGFLKSIGRYSDVGKPFVAKLKRLGGGTLTLPQDLAGKVVVVDFWATWCGPCVREIPRMKQLYAKYKSKGVEFVGISLDKSRSDLVRFVKDRKLDWIQTFTGKGRDDPTAGEYGVRSIPSIWVVAADGKIVSDDAQGKLEAVIKEALKAGKP